MNISYDYYRVFYFAAIHGSFTRAAAALMTNQPNVTRIISNLEGELGCPLFTRSKRGVALTPRGAGCSPTFRRRSSSFKPLNGSFPWSGAWREAWCPSAPARWPCIPSCCRY